MLLSIIKNTEWSHLLDFVSPAFFKVVRPGELAAQVATLSKAALSKKGYEERVLAFKPIAKTIFENELEIQSEGDVPETNWEKLPAPTRKEIGHLLLRIYFTQILHCPTSFIDLRPKYFGWEGRPKSKQLVWVPGNLRITWEEDVRRNLGELYRGFFKKDPRKFNAALDRLGLSVVKDIFLNHFGDGNNSAVRFTTKHFLESFHDVFVKLAEEKQPLKGQFVLLGVYLATLYESLERLDVPFNVRAQFLKADQPV